jgi:Tol biopolymer transport system component
VLRGLPERFTTSASDEFAPIWSPRGERLVYSGVREGSVELYEKREDGSEHKLDTGAAGIGKFAASWSPDGGAILYVGGGRIIAKSDLMLLPLEGDRRPKPYLDSEFVETQGRFSPDGRWVAYASNQTGRLEVYVRPYPGPGEPVRVSDNGGRLPQWRRNGTELFFIAPDNTLMSAAVGGEASPFQIRGVRTLFQTRPRPGVRLDAYFYDVAPDGQRFLVNSLVEGQVATPPITLVVNWPAALKK